MFRTVTVGFGFACTALLASVAQAHFIWLDLEPAAPGAQARLYFSEEPAPGEPHLLAKAGAAKTWLRLPSGKVTAVKLAPSGDENLAALVGECPNSETVSLEGNWDYGVFAHSPAGPVLLHYYAKRLAGDWTKQAALARAEKLKLDIAPAVADGKLAVTVLFEGKPLADAEIVFVDPQGDHQELKTDEQGRAAVPVRGGKWGVRAGHVIADRAGELDGKKYNGIWHYATALLEVPPGHETAAATGDSVKTAAKGDVSAGAALERARDGRAIWHDFPGFTADLTVRGNSEIASGKLTIDGDGSVTLDMPKSVLSEWAQEQMYSLVQHRMPDGEVSTGDVAWKDDNQDHPLGRLISLGDTEMASAYRLKNDVIMEVNRSMGKMRFTISVLEIIRNAEDKYLPRSFTMNFFDSASGDLRTSLAYLNEWQRVGQFDLPKTIVEVDAKKGGATTKEIEFANCKLLEGEQ